MDQSNLHDLLEKLRSSTAYADALAIPGEAPTQNSSTPAGPSSNTRTDNTDDNRLNEFPDPQADSAGISNRISSLLSRLRPQFSSPPQPQREASQNKESESRDNASDGMNVDNGNGLNAAETLQPGSNADYRHMTYVESLSRVEELLKDPQTVNLMLELQKSQKELEAKLWDGRQALQSKHEERIRAAKTTARIVTGSEELDEKETQRLNDELSKAEREYDLKHALPAWDALVTKQQDAMEKLGVPTMFCSTDRTDRARQQRVVRVMEQGLTEDVN
ncbi:hypothetical protein FRB90_007480 [Tulasnella sp. 427]|nr:hypothetical protein FRB90_007480 [Tulasnella sp. 427]